MPQAPFEPAPLIRLSKNVSTLSFLLCAVKICEYPSSLRSSFKNSYRFSLANVSVETPLGQRLGISIFFENIRTFFSRQNASSTFCSSSDSLRSPWLTCPTAKGTGEFDMNHERSVIESLPPETASTAPEQFSNIFSRSAVLRITSSVVIFPPARVHGQWI